MKLVVLNHKMNIEYSKLEEYISSMKEINVSNIDLVICPSNIYLLKFIEAGFVVGGQNVSFNEVGSYTGEIASSQLKSIGAKYCIVGHSERRKYFDESDNDINRKVKLLLNNDIKPIICVGESLRDKENNMTIDIVVRQVASALDSIPIKEIENIIIAYEPVWSIGSGIIPDNEYIIKVIKMIKEVVLKTTGKNIKVLYGGSVNDNNIKGFSSLDIIDGYLLGSVSLDPKRMSNLTKEL